MDKLWLIKDKKGQILGPYTEKEICSYIEEGRFHGEEYFSSYPSGKWKSLFARKIFYETALEALNKKPKPKEKEKEESPEEIIESTVIIPKKKEKKADSQKSAKKKKIRIKPSIDQEELGPEETDHVIEMEDLKEGVFKNLQRSLKLPLFLFALLVLSAVFFFPNNKKERKDQVRLLGLGQKREPWKAKEKKTKLKKL